MIEKIERLKTEKASDNNYLILQFSTESDVNEAIKIKAIAHQRIWWETYKKHEVFQCFNCQRIRHSSKNCNLAYRCIKCVEDNPRGHCKVNSGQERQSVNCQGNHPANCRGCDFIKEAQAERNNTARRSVETRLSFNKTNNTNNVNTQNLSQNFNTAANTLFHPTNPTTLNNSEVTELKNLISSF